MTLAQRVADLAAQGVLVLPPDHDRSGTYGGHQHIWVETGRHAPHVTFPPREPRTATYVRCSTCGQNGFRYPPRPVVYTWR